jgi:hypothetical protein
MPGAQQAVERHKANCIIHLEVLVMQVMRIGTGVHIRDELLERGDAFGLQASIFGSEVAIGLGMSRLMAVGAAQNILSEEVLRVGPRSRAHAQHDHRGVL